MSRIRQLFSADLRRLILSLVALAALVAPAAVASAQGSADLSAVYGRGVHAFFANQSLQADYYLTQVIDAGSTDPRVFYFRAMARQRSGRTYEAQQDMQIGAMYEARDPNAAGSVGQALMRVQGPQRQRLEQYRRQARMARAQQDRALAQTRYEETHRRETEVLRQHTPIELDQLDSPGAAAGQPAPPRDPAAAPTPQPQIVEEPPVAAEEPAADAADPFGANDAPPTAEPAAEPTQPDAAPAGDDPFGAGFDSAPPVVEETAPADAVVPEAPVDAPATDADPASPAGDDPFGAGEADAADPFGAGETATEEPAATEIAPPTSDAIAPAEAADAPAATDADPFGAGEDLTTAPADPSPVDGAATDAPADEPALEAPADANPPQDEPAADPFGSFDEQPSAAADPLDAGAAEEPAAVAAAEVPAATDAVPGADAGASNAEEGGVLSRIFRRTVAGLTPSLPGMPALPVVAPGADAGAPTADAFDLGPGDAQPEGAAANEDPFGVGDAADAPAAEEPAAEVTAPATDAAPTDDAAETTDEDPFGLGDDPFADAAAEATPANSDGVRDQTEDAAQQSADAAEEQAGDIEQAAADAEEGNVATQEDAAEAAEAAETDPGGNDAAEEDYDDPFRGY